MVKILNLALALVLAMAGACLAGETVYSAKNGSTVTIPGGILPHTKALELSIGSVDVGDKVDVEVCAILYRLGSAVPPYNGSSGDVNMLIRSSAGWTEKPGSGYAYWPDYKILFAHDTVDFEDYGPVNPNSRRQWCSSMNGRVTESGPVTLYLLASSSGGNPSGNGTSFTSQMQMRVVVTRP